MTAKEARHKTQDAINKKRVEWIFDEINKAAYKGLSEVQLHIDVWQKTQLTHSGYTVTESENKITGMSKISW